MITAIIILAGLFLLTQAAGYTMLAIFTTIADKERDQE